ncbi:MAG: hypothetical protein A2X64_07230 [Ignavibacteria bacterium GWF2_33_9]|nr:MAG: hypothetical protein A2X64_07230 [Ignavibacteria bacterium GWF2_33_9]
MNLLVFLLFIANTLFISYLASLIGGTYLSNYFRNLYLKKKKNEYLDFSLNMYEKLNNNILTPFGLGIAPLFSVVFIYIQFSDNPNNSIITSLILTTILFPIGLIIHKLDYKKHSKFLAHNPYSAFKGNSGLSYLSLFFFIVVALIFTGSEVSFYQNFGKAGSANIFSTIFSLNGIISFVLILAISYLFAIINFLKFEFKPKESDNDAYHLTKDKSSALFLYFGIGVFVLFLVRNFMFNNAIKNEPFWSIFLVALLSLIVSIYYVNGSKNNLQKSMKVPYAAFLIFILGFGGSDAMLFRNAADQNIAVISKKYDKEMEEFHITHAAETEVKVDAEGIYFDKCISCHDMDKKLVGPAFKDVVPKFKDNQEALKDFLLNPTKIDPNYPPMPNQGLKPTEAKALAEYLLKQIVQ